MREVVNINKSWAFSKSFSSVPSVYPDDWESVSIPHTWNAIDGQDGGNDYYRGICCYVRKLDKSTLPAADSYYLEFQGANSVAEVYVNGEKLCHHEGGYSTFRTEITKQLKDGENIIAVTVDNLPNDKVYPQYADFTFYGGIYRDVNIICTSETHFDLDYYGTPGIKVTPDVSGDVEVEVYTTDLESGDELIYTVFDREGAMISRTVSSDKHVHLNVQDVHLWDGIKEPYLYSVIVEIVRDGIVLDNVSARFGFRSFEIDPERGFILNGREYPLRGVSRHQDVWGKGNALTHEDHIRDMELICELGANTIRLAHYQHDQFFYDLCDEKGMVVWAEIPYISCHVPAGRENTLSQMKELVTQNYNHPSIVVWGLSNEITMRSASASDPDMLENHRMLNDMVHKMDSTRLTTMACVSMCRIDEEIVHLSDVVSYNHYFGWYGGSTDQNGPWLDAFHQKYPERPIGLSEYGCEALNWHNSTPEAGDYSEEYQAIYHEDMIRQINERPYLWATHVWNMFDFGADARDEGGESGQNHKGLVTFDRNYKKDAFYAYKVWLNPEAMIHICGKRYIDRVEEVTKVTVYSNSPWVELYANDVLLERKEAEDHFFYFNVPNKGETELVAKGQGDIEDKSLIRKVAEFNKDYRMVEKNAVLNWFDIKEREGYLSLNDRLDTVMETWIGNKMVKLIFKLVMKNAKDKQGADDMLKMMGSFTLIRLAGMAGGFSDKKISRKQLLKINGILNHIKKA